MDIKPIRTQRDYKAPLAEIEWLFDAKPGTEDGDRLDVLATLAEAYEQQHHPILPPDPVEANPVLHGEPGLEPQGPRALSG